MVVAADVFFQQTLKLKEKRPILLNQLTALMSENVDCASCGGPCDVPNHIFVVGVPPYTDEDDPDKDKDPDPSVQQTFSTPSGGQTSRTPPSLPGISSLASNNVALVSALAKAYRWQEQLESGEYAGLEDLAAASGVDRTYVGRILRLTSLAPEIVERILNGDEPDGISLRRLQKGVPAVWAEQTWC